MIARRPPRRKKKDIPPLENGDHLTQPEFHRRYEAMPEHVKAELIGGIVFMASPLRRPHSTHHGKLGMVLGFYEAHTPGVEALDNATTILGEDSEPQPDLALRILEDAGGQSTTNADEYVEGSPELIAEIAHSSRAIDLGLKKQDYEAAGVLEYVVVCVREKEILWFRLDEQRELRADREGIFRSEVFPGLWLDGPSLLTGKGKRLLEVVGQGLGSPEHAAFVQFLETARKKKRR